MNDAIKAVHVLIAGRVQGVGYRAWLQQRAQMLGVYGWVRNLADGRVEAWLEGDAVQVTQLLAETHRGPALAVPQKIEHWHVAGRAYGDFSVLADAATPLAPDGST